jgi:hypothetical protein
MSNTFTYQVIRDTTEQAVIKLTGLFDGSGQEDNAVRIQANTLYGALDANNVPLGSVFSASNTAKPYYGLCLNRVWADVTLNGSVEIYWNADEEQTLMFISRGSEFDGAGNWVTIPNNAASTANCTGDVGIRTRNMTANDTYTLIVELRKENEYYQRGQFNDPAAFNFGPYSLKP